MLGEGVAEAIPLDGVDGESAGRLALALGVRLGLSVNPGATLDVSVGCREGDGMGARAELVGFWVEVEEVALGMDVVEVVELPPAELQADTIEATRRTTVSVIAAIASLDFFIKFLH